MKKTLMLAMAIVVAAAWCGAAYAQATTADEQRISLDLRDADIRSALDMLFKSRPGSSYVLDSAVSGVVNMKLDEVTWASALRQMLRSANLDYRIEDNIYRIFQKSSAPTGGGPGGYGGRNVPLPGGGAVTGSASGPEGVMKLGGASSTGTVGRTGGAKKFELVTVRYGDPGELAYMFGGWDVGSQYGGGAMSGMMSGLGGFSGGGGMGGMGGYGGGMGGYGGGQGGYGGGQGGYGGGGMGGYGGGGMGGYGGGGMGGYGGGGMGGYGGGGRGGYGGGTGGYGGGGYGGGGRGGYGGGGYGGGGFGGGF